MSEWLKEHAWKACYLRNCPRDSRLLALNDPNWPVSPLEAVYTLELAGVRNHQCRAASPRLARDENVVDTDRFPAGSNSARTRPRFTRVFIIEHFPLERTGGERIEPPGVALR